MKIIQKCFLRIENHAFVESDFANFWSVVSRKIFQRDSVLVYFSTLCNLFSKLFIKEIVFTEIFQKVVIQKFRKIHSVTFTAPWKSDHDLIELFP